MKLGDILTFVMLDVFMYYTLFQFLLNSFKIFQLLTCIYKQSRKLCIAQKPVDLVLHCSKQDTWKRLYKLKQKN